MPENPLIKLLLDEPPRTAYCREGDRRERYQYECDRKTASRHHNRVLQAKCAGKYDGGTPYFLPHRLVVLRTASSSAFCTRIPDLQATIIQSQCPEVALGSPTMVTTNLHRPHPVTVAFSRDRPLGPLGQPKFHPNSSSLAKTTG